MEMGVRRAEAARRRPSAGRGHQGEWAPHLHQGQSSGHQAASLPSSNPSCVLKLPTPSSPPGLNPPTREPHLHSLRRFELRDVTTAFYRAGLGGPEEGAVQSLTELTAEADRSLVS